MEKLWTRHVGVAIVVLVTLFFALDAAMKLAGAQAAVQATGELGFSAGATRMLGLVLAASTIVYLVLVTRALGAVLITAYLGGAVAVQALHGSAVSIHVLFGAYAGVAVWGSIWLRNPALRQLMPLAGSAPQ